MLHAQYIEAIETRLRWLRWAADPSSPMQREPFSFAAPSYIRLLEHADTFYMNSHFCRLVDHARQAAPDSLTFDLTWLQADCGWIYIADPVAVPTIQAAYDRFCARGIEPTPVVLRAVGWQLVPAGAMLADNARTHGTEVVKPAPPGSAQFCCFKSFSDGRPGFVPWSYFLLRDGGTLGERVRVFEEVNIAGGDGSNYVRHPEDSVLHPLHEIRWIYAALYLMAQRLAVTVQHATDRHTRRRAEREQQQAPPFVRVISLRRLEQVRPRSGTPAAVDWQWQWEVRGHWRNQFYPSEGVHKPKFIEAYVKGPADKPLKEGTTKLFAAVR